MSVLSLSWLVLRQLSVKTASKWDGVDVSVCVESLFTNSLDCFKVLLTHSHAVA